MKLEEWRPWRGTTRPERCPSVGTAAHAPTAQSTRACAELRTLQFPIVHFPVFQTQTIHSHMLYACSPIRPTPFVHRTTRPVSTCSILQWILTSRHWSHCTLHILTGHSQSSSDNLHQSPSTDSDERTRRAVEDSRPSSQSRLGKHSMERLRPA